MKTFHKERILGHLGRGLKSGLLTAAFRRKPLLVTADGLGVLFAMKTERGKKWVDRVFPAAT